MCDLFRGVMGTELIVVVLVCLVFLYIHIIVTSCYLARSRHTADGNGRCSNQSPQQPFILPVHRARPGPRLLLLFFLLLLISILLSLLEHVSGGNCTLFAVSLCCDANVNDDAR